MNHNDVIRVITDRWEYTIRWDDTFKGGWRVEKPPLWYRYRFQTVTEALEFIGRDLEPREAEEYWHKLALQAYDERKEVAS
jgi:hypothetical protein